MTTGSISSYFVGVPGGLIMSFIAFSIVFIVIVGLMLVMMGMKHVCSAIDNMNKPKPVSYTHLDVYKRQLQVGQNPDGVFPRQGAEGRQSGVPSERL